MSSLKFLVVDDASFIRDMLKKSLRNNFPGCEISDAANGRKAQSLMRISRFDLILCDWEMPEMSGEELLHWVRGSDEYKAIPFIMVTSRGEKEFIVKAVQAGVSDYLGKPFTPEKLVDKVSKALRKAGIEINEPKKAGGLGSADLLTGAPTASAAKPKADAGGSASVLTGGAAAKPAAAKKSKAKKSARGQAQIKFSTGGDSQCVISDITLQLMSGAIKRGETLPAILEPVVISIVQNDGEDVARLNGYIHSLQAGENNMDAAVLKLQIRFVDDDPVKLEQLSRYIGNL